MSAVEDDEIPPSLQVCRFFKNLTFIPALSPNGAWSAQFLFDNFAEEVVFVTKELCLSEESLSVIPRVLCNFAMLQRLDISRNLFRSLPVKIIDEYMPSLRALDVSYNRLENMRNVQQLGILKELRELNLLGNPLVAINQRADLLAHLIFGNKRPRRDCLEAMLQYQRENVGRVSAAQQALPVGTAAAESKPKVIASESTSRMMISGLLVGGVLPTHAVKILNSAVSASAREYGAVVYADLTPAPVPRATGTPFRMLTQLNNKRITKEDLDQAARTCASASGEAVCVDSLMVDTVHAKLPVHAATKKTKLKGKAKMQELERQLKGIERERRERTVDKALRRLMRHGTLQDTRGGAGGWGGGAGHGAVGSDDGSSDDGLDRNSKQELNQDQEAESGEDDNGVLNVVGECGRRPLSVCASLWMHVQEEDSVASAAPSSQSSPRIAQAEATLAAASLTSHTAQGAEASAATRVPPASAVSGNGEKSLLQRKSHRHQRPRAPGQAWVTCPPAWWISDSETSGVEAQELAATLPTRQSVVEMGEEELCLARKAVAAVATVTRRDESADGKAKVSRSLPPPTEEELLMRSESRVGWALVEEELRDRDERMRRELAKKPRPWRGGSGGRPSSAASMRRVKGPKDLSVTIGEALQLELPARRDYDSTLLHRRLPLHFKRLKLDKFLMEGNRDEERLTESAEAVGRELDAVFTATNIRNKLEASSGGGPGKTSLAWEQRKMDQQAAQGRWQDHLSQHQMRLRMLKRGRWPSNDETGQKYSQGMDGAAGLSAASASSAEGAPQCPVAKELARELNKIDKARNGALQSPTSKTSEPSHAELSGPARARLEASRGIPRPSQAWRFQVAGDMDRSDEAIKCELDAMLLAGPQQASDAHDRRGVSEVDAPAPDAATTLRKHAMLQVQQELNELQETLAHDRRALLEQRRDLGTSMDKLIIARRFGMAEGRKTLVGGLEFDG